MLPSTYEEQHCPIARALEIVGERWTLLILRDAFLGVRRFDDFQAQLGVSRNVLARRMVHLVEAGLLEREPYHERPVRYEYLLTERARDLWPVILGLAQWGARDERARSLGVTREFLHDECGHRVRTVAHCAHCDVETTVTETSTRPGPAYGGSVTSDVAGVLGEPRPLLTPVRVQSPPRRVVP